MKAFGVDMGDVCSLLLSVRNQTCMSQAVFIVTAGIVFPSHCYELLSCLRWRKCGSLAVNSYQYLESLRYQICSRWNGHGNASNDHAEVMATRSLVIEYCEYHYFCIYIQVSNKDAKS